MRTFVAHVQAARDDRKYAGGVNFFRSEIGRVRDQNTQNNFDWAIVDLMFEPLGNSRATRYPSASPALVR